MPLTSALRRRFSYSAVRLRKRMVVAAIPVTSNFRCGACVARANCLSPRV